MISIEFRDNSTGHNDIVLSFAGKELIADSYYFALDQGIMPKREDAVKIRAVLRKLLEQWLNAMPEDNQDCVVFLPYAFFDQSTCWLKCVHENGSVTVYHGWSEVEGWSFSPSDISNYVNGIEDFNEDGPSETMLLTELSSAINDSLSKVAHQGV